MKHFIEGGSLSPLNLLYSTKGLRVKVVAHLLMKNLKRFRDACISGKPPAIDWLPES